MNKNRRFNKSLVLTAFGTMLTAFSVSTILNPNKIVSGGVSGISIIMNNLFQISLGISYAVINILLLLFGFKLLGREFTVNTVLGAGMLTVFVQMFSYLPPVTKNNMLASIFGGLLYGLGIGITFSVGASTGGTDIIGRIIQHYRQDFPIGKLLLFTDGAVIFSSLLCFKNTELVLFGIVALFISTYTIDYLIQRLNISKIAFVITERGEEISELLISTSPRGITLIDVKGAFSSENKKLLFCALKENEVPEFQRKIHSIDKEAFIVFAQSQQIVGNGFYVYR